MSTTPEILLETARFRVVEYTVATAGEQRPLKKQVVVHPGAVVILPLLEGDRVCLIRNFRIAVDRELIELPAGTLDRPESPLNTAQRELQEETGFTAINWQELAGFFMSPGILHERIHAFVARDLQPGEAALEPGEVIENLIVGWEDAVAMALDGRIEDAKSVALILKWDRLRSAH